MTRTIQTRLDRAQLYLDRVKRDLDRYRLREALPHCAELAEISRRLYGDILVAAKEKPLPISEPDLP